MFSFSSEILCCVSGLQMNAENINFINLYWKSNFIYFGKQMGFTIKIKTGKKSCDHYLKK